MAQFGWAYVNCDDTSGADMGIRYVSSSAVTASSTFIYDIDNNKVTLDGDMEINGAITASFFVVDQTEVLSGSTIFGNTTDDTHQITGSLFVGASASAPVFTVSPLTSQSVTTGFRVSYQSITASGVTSSNNNYILGIGGSSALEFRIHSASTAGSGAILLVKDEAGSRSGPITISASSGDTIDGAGSYEISGSSPAISLYSNGANWFVF
jgi:hypothetical protein